MITLNQCVLIGVTILIECELMRTDVTKVTILIQCVLTRVDVINMIQ